VPDTTVIAVAGIAGTALTPLIAGRVQRGSDQRRFAAERADRDLDERRALLDTAAQELSSFIEAVEKGLQTSALEQDWSHETWHETIEPMRRHRDGVHVMNQRLVIRLGRRNPVVTAFGTATALSDRAAGVMMQRVAMTTDAALRAVAAGEMELKALGHTALEEDGPRVAALRAAHDAFLDAATALVGNPYEPAERYPRLQAVRAWARRSKVGRRVLRGSLPG
jgi:hypothetical protein